MDLKAEILELEGILESKKKQLFLNRLEKITNCSIAANGISDLDIQHDADENTWQISYTHKTDQYSKSMYSYSEDSDLDPDQRIQYVQKETKISFGISNKYFIKGGIKLNVYRNKTKELRIINPDYEFDLDLDEQKKLVREYSENHNLPEWFAIAIMLYLLDNDWDDSAFINYISIV